MGQSLAETVKKIWDRVIAKDSLQIRDSYTFNPQATPHEPALPVEEYKSEINLIVFNHQDAFITIPGEFSTVYDRQLKDIRKQLDY